MEAGYELAKAAVTLHPAQAVETAEPAASEAEAVGLPTPVPAYQDAKLAQWGFAAGAPCSPERLSAQ